VIEKPVGKSINKTQINLQTGVEKIGQIPFVLRIWIFLMGFVIVGGIIGVILLKITSSQVFNSCDNNSQYIVGSYMVLNNEWNLRDIKTGDHYQQCIWAKNTESNGINAGWNWSWPEGTKGVVKAYPEIIFGWAPWLPRTTDTRLPVQLSKMGGFTATYDVAVSSQSGGYDTTFDLWTTSAIPPRPSNRTTEIMIFIDKQNFPIGIITNNPHGWVLVDGHEYDYVIVKNPTTANFIRFVSKDSLLKGSINIDYFLKFLVEKGYLSPQDFLADIEFGNEIQFGTGQTIIRSYSITSSEYK
jgi:hypothetical protein